MRFVRHYLWISNTGLTISDLDKPIQYRADYLGPYSHWAIIRCAFGYRVAHIPDNVSRNGHTAMVWVVIPGAPHCRFSGLITSRRLLHRALKGRTRPVVLATRGQSWRGSHIGRETRGADRSASDPDRRGYEGRRPVPKNFDFFSMVIECLKIVTQSRSNCGHIVI